MPRITAIFAVPSEDRNVSEQSARPSGANEALETSATMRNFFLLVTTVAGAWGGLQMASNWGSQLVEQVSTGAVNPMGGMLAIPGVLVGGVLGLLVGALVMPKVH